MIFAKRSSTVCAILAGLLIIGLVCCSIRAINPPHALPKDAPADQFSAHRAIAHAFACSKQTHPAGSLNDDQVAEYYLNALKEMGVETEFMCKPAVQGNHVMLQRAVIGRIRGTNSTGAIAFSAHYDSVPYGPGATDDISGCIAMLEAARASMHQPRIGNDLLFIFADAEEIGGCGAQGFCSHPLAQKIGIINELDVRGVKGPALIYETSSGNGALIAELRKARADGVLPVTSSMMVSVYERSPFGSDFTKFRRAGMSGYNVAYIDKFAWYHTANDSPEHINPDSIQHFGAHVMGITKHFANADFGALKLKTSNDIYFNTLGFHLVQYPMALGKPLAIFAIACLLVVIALGFAKRRIAIGGYLKALLLFPVVVVLSAAAAFGILALVFGYHNAVYLYTVKITYIPEPRALYDGNLYCYAMALMAIAITGLIYWLASRRLRAEELHAAALTWLCPVLAAMVAFFPGGSYLGMWSVFFGALGLALLYFGDREQGPGPALLLASLLFAAPALCLLPPGWLILMWMINILGAPLLAALVVLLMLNLMPAFTLFGRVRHSWTIWAAAALLAVLLISTGMLMSKPSKDRPLMNSVVYVANLDTKEAWWVSEDVKVDEWTKQFFPDGKRAAIEDILPGRNGSHYLRASAPVAAALRGIRCDVVKDQTVDGKRRITAKLVSGDYPLEVHLRQIQGPAITGFTVEGAYVTPNPSPFSLSFTMLPSKGYDVTFETTPGDAIIFEASSTVYGFPEIPGVTPRPDYMVPEPNTMRNGISLRSQHIYVKNRFQIASCK
ncbi:MAG: M20/M25/M40 family metallo-hydrolase [Verrucomicrobiota bacterium]